MADIMEEVLNMDKQGRIVLPARIRRALGMVEGGKLAVRLDGSRIILEPIPEDLEKSVEEWSNFVRSMKIEAFTEKPEESWKWISREYAERKLGLA
ncbi:MAG: AbrB/MazE/SpoVT family DNA-binding domain-containing protein [Thermoproteota archaeon]